MNDKAPDPGSPDILEPSGIDDGMRDPASGRFVSGHRGIGGRPKGVDFKALIRERKGQGPLEDVLVAIFDALAETAATGDVAAAKLLLDRLTTDDDVVQGGVFVRLTTGIPDEGAA